MSACDWIDLLNLSLPSRERELKHFSLLLVDRSILSLPSRERELKRFIYSTAILKH